MPARSIVQKQRVSTSLPAFSTSFRRHRAALRRAAVRRLGRRPQRRHRDRRRLRGAASLPQPGRHGGPDHQRAAARRLCAKASSTRLGVPSDSLRRHRKLRRRDHGFDRGAPGRAGPSHRSRSATSRCSTASTRRSCRSSVPNTWCAQGCSTTPRRRRTIIADVIAAMRARSLPMICANPDIVVERGDQLVYCAGAIAERLCRNRRRRDLCRQAVSADLRAGDGGGAGRARTAPSIPSACWRSANSVRTDLKGADGLRHRLPVRDRRHPCRGIGRAGQPGCVRARGHVCRGRQLSEAGDAAAGMVMSSKPPAAASARPGTRPGSCAAASAR